MPIGAASATPSDLGVDLTEFAYHLGERDRAEEVAALFVESCLAGFGARQALHMGVELDGRMTVRFSFGYAGLGELEVGLDEREHPLVRALLAAWPARLDAAELAAIGIDAQTRGSTAPGDGLAVPITTPPLVGRIEALAAHCTLHAFAGRRTAPCWAFRGTGTDPSLPPPEIRLGTLCSGCLAFAPIGVVVLERDRPFTAREVERLGLLAQLAGQRIRALEAVRGAERALDRVLEKQEWLETVMRAAADPIVVTDSANRLVVQNRRAEELLVVSSADSAGRRRAIEINDMMLSAFLSSLGLDPEIPPREMALVNPLDGTDLLFEAISTQGYATDGRRLGVVTVLRDITDLQRATQEVIEQVRKAREAEAAIRQERDRLDMVVRSAVDPIVVTNVENEIVLANAEGERLFQARAADSADRQRAVRHNDAHFSTYLTELATDWSGQGKRELQLRDPSTGGVRPFEVTAGKLRGERSQTMGVVSVFHDLTGVRELERGRIEQRLFASEKLAATGRLAASIAHEMNNPLESIKNSLHVLEARIPAEGSAAQFLDIARRECERVSKIIKQFLGIYRPTKTHVAVDLNQLIEDELRLLDNQLAKRGIEVVRVMDAVPLVPGSEDQLKQVFLNLLLNAIESMVRGGTLTVTTRRHSEPSALSPVAPSVLATIGDTGPGISAELLPRLFEPFFTTKEEKGTGLGLWVSEGIVRAHKGDIRVETAPDRGTRFHVLLPTGEGS